MELIAEMFQMSQKIVFKSKSEIFCRLSRLI